MSNTNDVYNPLGDTNSEVDEVNKEEKREVVRKNPSFRTFSQFLQEKREVENQTKRKFNLARQDLLNINESIKHFNNSMGRAARNLIKEVRLIKQAVKDEIKNRNRPVTKEHKAAPEGMYLGGKRTRKRRGGGKNNGNILKKTNVERSKQRLARMGLRQRSGNKTEKNHKNTMNKLRKAFTVNKHKNTLAAMGLRQRSRNNNAKIVSGESKNSRRNGVLAKTNNLKMGGRRKKKTRKKKRKKRGGRPFAGEVTEDTARFWRERMEREEREREAVLERSRRQRERLREERERRERARIMSRAGQLFPNRNFTLEEAKNAVETHNIHNRIMYNVIPEATEVQNAVEINGGKIRTMMASIAEPILTGIPMATVVGTRVRVGGKNKTKKRKKKKYKKTHRKR